tara:strand:- start:1187 stop:2368 length:1182 start_codon:yes stop_codon:yes gene_type:complete
MNIIIFEDSYYKDLKPFIHNHASFEIKTGLISNIDRIKLAFNKYNLILIVRDNIKDFIQEKYPSCIVNPNIIPPGHCINGKVVWENDYDKLYLNDNHYTVNNHSLIYKNSSKIKLKDFNKIINSKITGNENHSIKIINYLWDAIDLIAEMIRCDSGNHIFKLDQSKHKSVLFIKADRISVGDKSIIRPGSILDAEKGPVIIGDNVVVDIGSKIQGPVFIDNNSYIAPGAKIRSNNIIGEGSKIGGEISNTIFHANSNKVHDGFMGHSYICEWVNIGAGTNNSNLKNNYSSIKFDLGCKKIDTKRIFLGSLIGDYSRIGISTMLNTGTYIGFGANIFGGNFKKKFNQSFSWGDDNIVELDKFIETCINMKKRRNKNISLNEKKLIIEMYNDKTN